MLFRELHIGVRTQSARLIATTSTMAKDRNHQFHLATTASYFIVLEIQFWLFACFTRSSEKDEEFGKDCKKMMLAVTSNYWGKLD